VGKCQANQSSRIFCHEVNVFGLHALGGNDQVAFIFAILIIHQYHHLAEADIVDNFFNRIKLHGEFCVALLEAVLLQ
jgi:hypothetical protein